MTLLRLILYFHSSCGSALHSADLLIVLPKWWLMLLIEFEESGFGVIWSTPVHMVEPVYTCLCSFRQHLQNSLQQSETWPRGYWKLWYILHRGWVNDPQSPLFFFLKLSQHSRFLGMDSLNLWKFYFCLCSLYSIQWWSSTQTLLRSALLPRISGADPSAILLVFKIAVSVSQSTSGTSPSHLQFFLLEWSIFIVIILYFTTVWWSI